MRLTDTMNEPVSTRNLDQYGHAELPWNLYRLTLHTAVGVATAEPHGATRWDFAH